MATGKVKRKTFDPPISASEIEVARRILYGEFAELDINPNTAYGKRILAMIRIDPRLSVKRCVEILKLR